MNLFKSIFSTILVYVVIVLSIAFTVVEINDVNQYAAEAQAIEIECRDGNYDNAQCYQVNKAEDGSYTVEFGARYKDEMAVKSYYNAEGTYLYTEREVGGYIFTDILGGVGIALVLAGLAYFVYTIVVAILEFIVRKIKKAREAKKAQEVKDLEFVDLDQEDAKEIESK